MATSSSKIPPLLSKSPVYTDWKKKIDIWSSFTSLEKEKQGAALLLTLEGEAEDAALELDVSVINSNDGLKSVIQQLDKLYLKDKTLEKFQVLDAFDSYQRKPETSIHEHIHNFDKLYFKLKSHGTTISEDLLAYKLLKSANLSPADEKLAKGTANELTLVSMKSQLKKIFPDANSISLLLQKRCHFMKYMRPMHFHHRELTLFEDEAVVHTNAMPHVFPSILAL